MSAHGGGEVRMLAGVTGWNFDNGGLTLSAEYWLQEPLKMGERRFLRCDEDRVWDANGNLISADYSDSPDFRMDPRSPSRAVVDTHVLISAALSSRSVPVQIVNGVPEHATADKKPSPNFA